MAAEALTLPEQRAVAGIEIMGLTDQVGFDATGAGWAFTTATGTWRFYLFTAMVDTKGPIWIWERLARAFGKLSLPAGITPLDIVVASPNEALYRSVLAKAGDAPSDAAALMVLDMSDAGHGIDRIWLLRGRKEEAVLQDVARRDAAVRRFDRRLRRLLAA